jgi:hypothetical protein
LNERKSHLLFWLAVVSALIPGPGSAQVALQTEIFASPLEDHCLSDPTIDSADAQGKGRSMRTDGWETVRRIPGVLGEQWLSRAGIVIHIVGLPVVGGSFYQERETSDFFREHRIRNETIDDMLDVTGLLYPCLSIPFYVLGRISKSDLLAELSIDMATFTIVMFPEELALRAIGDRPRPDGSKDFAFGLEMPSSFPSGHTAVTVGIARLVDYHYGHFIGIPLYLLAAAVGYQRLGAGEHYLADVLGGALFGFEVADAIVRIRENEKDPSQRSRFSLRTIHGIHSRATGLALTWAF